MADENELKELINQAITCEHPHVFGTVNLNRLRDVLCLLVAARKPYDESFKEDLENHSLDGETESSHEGALELSKEEAKCNSLHIVDDELETTAHETNLIEIEEDLNTASRSLSLNDLEQPCSTLSLQKILLEIEEIGQRVNHINERVSGLEIKLLPEQRKCKCSCGVIEYDEHLHSSNTDVTQAEKTLPSKKPSTETNAKKSNFDVEQDERLNDVNDTPTEREAAPSQAVDGNSIHKSTSAESDISSKTFKNNTPAPTNADVPHDQQENEKSTLPASTSDIERNKVALVKDSLLPKFDELVATVDGFVERERMFFERLANIEKLMSSTVEELYSRLQEKECVSPIMDFHDNSGVQDLQPESCTTNAPTSIHRKDGTESLLETNLRSIIDQVQIELCSLKTAFNRLNIAAGGKVGADIRTHVQCISCNCAAAMEVHEELVQTPVPFHVRRCMKPMLSRQREWLQKELKFPAVVPVSMEPYYKLLMENNSLQPK
ncbi:uncharacterized protein LOC126564605 [Anopheles maculipalpis]|uniref:uncharacterized protein LOC126564605 n=1 Tax=Anopheles maculipalpis TaxID=1496333 RepID=UPI002158E953|nr:uncharacterized protein LOC126564605 [Anopheles maculipalpis]